MEAQTERIGQYEFQVATSEASKDFNEQAADRADVLAQWLLAQWERDQQEGHRDGQHHLN